MNYPIWVYSLKHFRPARDDVKEVINFFFPNFSFSAQQLDIFKFVLLIVSLLLIFRIAFMFFDNFY